MSQRLKLGLGLLTFALFAGLTLTASAQGEKKKGPFTDEEFVKKVASDGMHEVELGKLAQQKGTSAEVKKFGQHMVDDHSKANQELMQVAQSAGISVPTMMMPKHQKDVEKFRGLQGAEFDREYANHMVKDHQTAVAMFQRASLEAKNAPLKAFATKTLPTLQEHLQHAQRLQQQVAK